MADLSIAVYGRAGGLSQIQGPPANLSATLSEALHIVSNTVTETWDGTGDVAFMASTGHATVTGYTLRLRVSGSSTVVATDSLGVPVPDGNGVIVVSEATFFGAQAAGTYTVSILATDPGGSTDSVESDAFTLPLS